jgi:hypothetical protein
MWWNTKCSAKSASVIFMPNDSSAVFLPCAFSTALCQRLTIYWLSFFTKCERKGLNSEPRVQPVPERALLSAQPAGFMTARMEEKFNKS